MFPSVCSDITTSTSYDDLNALIGDVSDACSFDAYLQMRIADAAGDAVAAHQAEIDRLAEAAQTAQNEQDALVQQLF